MSLHDPVRPPSAGRTDPDPPEPIEEGRRLIRARGDAPPTIADRLSEGLHRLGERMPLADLRLRGRYPLKLLATPDDPVPGDAARGRALLGGRMAFMGEERALETLDPRRPDWSARFADHLQSFAWLRDLSTVATTAEAAPIAAALTARWLGAHADTVEPVAWRPELWGRRVLAWTAHSPLILFSPGLTHRSRVLGTLARGGRYLAGSADRAPAGAPRIAAWCGVVACGLLLPDGDARIGEAGLARALETGLFEDGGAVSRSPATLLDIVDLLASLRACYDARRLDPTEAVARALARTVPALLGATHGDGGLAGWQGGGPVPAARVAAVVAASGVRARPLRQPRDWGYQRLAAGSAVLLLDAAPPPVGRAVEGGCASTLAFELSDGPVRLVVSCGGARAGAASLPRALTEGLRTTAAHSTLTLADTNSTAVLPGGALGRGVGEVELSRSEGEAGSRVEATHDGYQRRFGLLHRRRLTLSPDGRELRGEDALVPRGRAARPDRVPFALRFHLGAGVEPVPTADGAAAVLRTGAGGLWQFRCRGAALSVEDSVWIDADGRAVPTRQLVVMGEAAMNGAGAGGAEVGWVLKRAR